MWYPDFKENFARAIEELRGRKVAVLGHMRPDGDCIGSQVAMVRGLRSLGCEAVAVNGHPVPENCRAFLADVSFLSPKEIREEDGYRVVTVDCAAPDRVGDELSGFAGRVFLNVDHHISNKHYGEVNLIESHSSATAEILGGLFLDHGIEVDSGTAAALYLGIATDTGQFQFGSTSSRTFRLCAELVERGADPAAFAQEMYENEPPAKMKLLQRFLASMKYHCDGRVCIGVLDRRAWEASGADPEHTEGLVDFARGVSGVEIGVLLEEKNGKTKGSFRAKEPHHRVDQLAIRFNGGGHACAAGFNPKMPLRKLYPILVQALEEHFRKLDEKS